MDEFLGTFMHATLTSTQTTISSFWSGKEVNSSAPSFSTFAFSSLGFGEGKWRALLLDHLSLPAIHHLLLHGWSQWQV